MQWADKLWPALALVLVIEGALPLISPARWRRVFTQMLQLRDGQIRFCGLLSMALGVIMLLLL
jgi:uncharacterized protein YjeT (DUF2065 family)